MNIQFQVRILFEGGAYSKTALYGPYIWEVLQSSRVRDASHLFTFGNKFDILTKSESDRFEIFIVGAWAQTTIFQSVV